jgi:hypothetical protein
MAAEQFTGDFNTIGGWGGAQPVVREFAVDAGGAGATIAVGDLVTVDSTAGYVEKAPAGAANTVNWVGRAVTNSTETASVDGVVEVEYCPGGLIVRGAPTTPGNLAQSIIGTQVTLDGTAPQTIDENDTSNGVLTVLAYDDTSGAETIDVVVPCTYVD